MCSNIKLEELSLFGKSRKIGLHYLIFLDIDRLLAPSFEMQGLTPPNNAKRYCGWEGKAVHGWGSDDFTLAGHSLGHFMSAAALMVYETENSELLNKLNYIVDKLEFIQTATNSGYIGGCNEETFKKLFSGDKNWHKGYWVPWYNIHKIYQGLIDTYLYTKNKKALDVLIKFADWAVLGTKKLTDEQMQEMLSVEYGGMNEVFAALFEITGNSDYLDTAGRFTHDNILNPLCEGKDELTAKHANTIIPKIIGAAKLYEQNNVNYKKYKDACINFWNIVANKRSYAIGGNSIYEHFEAEGAETLGVKTCESCNSYNMLKLTEHLFKWEHKVEYADYYENILYNHILGQQDPDTGAKMYFVSLLQGHHRIYEKKEESWWCCTGTGMENPGRYTKFAYFSENDNLYFNLYMPSTYTWQEKGLVLKTQTDYPYSDKVKITVISGDANAALHFRAPAWLEKDMEIEINGKLYSQKCGEYFSVNKNWAKDDAIILTIPMDISVYHSREKGKIAFKYGFVTLASQLALLNNTDGVEEYVSNETVLDSVTVDVPYLTASGCPFEKSVEEVDRSSLSFKIPDKYVSDGKEIFLKPFYEIHHHFYNVYWNTSKEDEYEKELNKVTIDCVVPDGQQDEIGHNLKYENSNQSHLIAGTKTYYCREAFGSSDAYFEYTMKTDNDKEYYLFVRYWGCDTAFKAGETTYKREFNIYIDGNLIATQILDKINFGNVFDIFYHVKNIAENDSIVVRFSPVDEQSCAGKILEIRTTSKVMEK